MAEPVGFARLFNPARYAGLPGMRFPGRGDRFPTKEQVVDYLVEYARRFRLPVRNGIRVDRLWKEEGRFVMTAGSKRFESENVVVAMANYQVPRVPDPKDRPAPNSQRAEVAVS